MSTRTYSVPGVSCDHCKRSIESELNKVEGVDLADVDVTAKLVLVEGAASDEAIRGAIEEAGFDEVALVTA